MGEVFAIVGIMVIVSVSVAVLWIYEEYYCKYWWS